MARGCAYSYNCSLTTSPSIFLPAMPLWLQPSEHLFHSLVIALLRKKKSKQAKLFLRTGMNSASQLHLQMTGAAEGKEGRKFGSNRSPLLKSQHRRRFTCTKVPKTAKMYLGSICRARRRAGRYDHLGFPWLVPAARASAHSSGAVSHGPVLYIESVNQSLNILYSLRSLSKPL